MTLFGPILVSRKIWVIEQLWNVLTVFGKAKTRLTGNSAFWLYQKWTFSEPQPFNIVFFQQCAVFSHLSNYNSQMFNFGRFLATKNVQNFDFAKFERVKFAILPIFQRPKLGTIQLLKITFQKKNLFRFALLYFFKHFSTFVDWGSYFPYLFSGIY